MPAPVAWCSLVARNRERRIAGDPAQELAERLLAAAAASMDLMAIALGDRLGYYRVLADRGELSSTGLAEATGTSERYMREWLEQQAVAGLLDVGGGPAAGDRRFRLAPGVAQVLATPDDLSHLAPLARQLVAANAQLPAVAVAAASRTGEGCPGPRSARTCASPSRT